MMFDKSNTQTGGESLCKSCKWSLPIPGDISKNFCLWSDEVLTNVGVCKDYEDFRTDDNDDN